MYFILEFKTPKSAKVIANNMQGYGSYLNSHLFQCLREFNYGMRELTHALNGCR